MLPGSDGYMLQLACYNQRQRRFQLSSTTRSQSHAESVRVAKLSVLPASSKDVGCSSMVGSATCYMVFAERNPRLSARPDNDSGARPHDHGSPCLDNGVGSIAYQPHHSSEGTSPPLPTIWPPSLVMQGTSEVRTLCGSPRPAALLPRNKTKMLRLQWRTPNRRPGMPGIL